jgi:hypothetical protein
MMNHKFERRDRLAPYRKAVEEQEERFGRERRRERARQIREEDRRAAAAAEAVQAGEVAQLRAELDAWKAIQAEAVGEAIAKFTDEVIDRFEAHTARVRSSILDAVEARFTALEMALKSAEARAAKSFQFAREKDVGEVVDLPNPLRPRRLDS